MGWLNDDQGMGSGKLKPIWEYRAGVECVTVLPNETRDFALISGDLDPTKTWDGPIGVWIHQFKNAKGFQTVVCNKWNEACVCCYENEIYKLHNPNYKNTGGKLPMGLSKKALIQVYDIKMNRVLWLFAGKSIMEGMDFLMTRFADKFNGFISITRSGEGFATSYRVDMGVSIPIDMNLIAPYVIKKDDVAMYFILSHQEIAEKTGYHPVNYFQMKRQSFPSIDISGWGQVPVGTPQVQSQPNSAIQQPVTAGPNPAIQQPVTGLSPNMVPPPISAPVQVSDLAKSMLQIKCTQGIYVGQAIGDVIKQTGKPYIQYLLRSGNEQEKQASQVILNEWDSINLFIRGEAF